MLDCATLSLNGAEVAGMDRDFMYFGNNVSTT
ncbi:hypothetical protein SAMN05443635_107200 [Roseobacter denitrificans OCh 114]|uniref:Uncharacterized protein n=1 Tax=Roseobacter denitrificans (strain ATCC 33942 / OCh 114) TaxID=375451 RepID=Q162Z8_ROSDO|nr:hypothetical protein RD1_3458 [Roseobacter denitrificans OCh 114]SFG10735.1 hypothetical protein SAMN05443635_107200 [Roseobacter denitrificans OCh 114]